MLRLLNRLLRIIGLELRRKSRSSDGSGRLAALRPAGPSRGAVLISYIPDDVLSPEDAVSASHTHYWECRQMAHCFRDIGFDVDVIDFADTDFIPQKPYDILVSARTDLERLAQHVPTHCLKVAHLDTAHFLTNNANATERLRQIRDRHGVALRSTRMVESNWALEAADVGCVLGNAFTEESYRFAGKPIHRIPLSSVRQYDWLTDKDFDACRNTYLWFGSGGFAHKGLDLVIDAFAELPDHRLLICGPTDREPRFMKAFEQAMFHSANIETIGWVDITGPEFNAIRQETVATIYPSCSEGGGGSTITCMHAGLIPVVTPEASVDVGEFGIVLQEASAAAIRDAVLKLSGLPVAELEQRARTAWEHARARHTREGFAAAYERFVKEIVVPEVERRRASA
jgi:glycosyltransferase involved in cell wall biosynthesis